MAIDINGDFFIATSIELGLAKGFLRLSQDAHHQTGIKLGRRLEGRLPPGDLTWGSGFE